MSRRGHVPKRTCVGCGRRFAKPELVRLTVEGAEGSRRLALDPSGKGAGRGAYVCASRDCFDRATSAKGRGRLRRLEAAAIPSELGNDFMNLLKSRE